MGVIVITGGSRGIGASTALECAKRGFGVILTYKSDVDAANSIVRRISETGAKAVALELDVSDTSTFAGFRRSVEQMLLQVWNVRRITGLINNAGHGLFNRIETVSESEFDGLFNVHLKGPFFLTQTLLPLFSPESSIVNITSATTRVATAGVAPYASFKGALEVLTRYMAKEFGDMRIRVNAVSPGAIRTELGGGVSREFEAALISQTALGRIGEPDEVARAIVSLFTADGQWINAQTIEVSGGYVI
ncbi:SDR family NAD(P)-dependent oxidoreductase [Paraburkholderia bryophila]|uniref:NAD(P)-dependent dehydrogenase (Short-subunit alcohol dehydrogenase family) n=1 Tax=Paraburkholderia bryophila TaxID=420952 RepID=A0A329CAR4_9BURK|nr:SDR family oxidoreductase [Paraburkholderia bryophila]RAS32076.1 NAD(P)-dependent dehydrogenase (short-subunit alcohol dehydrogenase family) [Paraburkholderia bryophila]